MDSSGEARRLSDQIVRLRAAIADAEQALAQARAGHDSRSVPRLEVDLANRRAYLAELLAKQERPMSARQPATIGHVLHHMYAASADPFRFPDALARLLGMHVSVLGALYDLPAPDPAARDFGGQVWDISVAVGCAPDMLAELLLRWTPRQEFAP